MSRLGEAAAREAAEVARRAAREGVSAALGAALPALGAALAVVAAVVFAAIGVHGKLAAAYGPADAALILALGFLLLAGIILAVAAMRAGRAAPPPPPETGERAEPEAERRGRGPMSDVELATLVAATFRDAAEVGRDLRRGR
ncbi:MAG: hypothetical protein ACQEUZ_06745 [Pseudomonadota bacterium]